MLFFFHSILLRNSTLPFSFDQVNFIRRHPLRNNRERINRMQSILGDVMVVHYRRLLILGDLNKRGGLINERKINPRDETKLLYLTNPRALLTIAYCSLRQNYVNSETLSFRRNNVSPAGADFILFNIINYQFGLIITLGLNNINCIAFET